MIEKYLNTPEAVLQNTYLIAVRKERGLSQKELAKIVGVTVETISEYENIRIIPSLAKKQQIANTLGVSTESIFPKGIEEFRKYRRPLVQKNKKPIATNILSLSSFSHKLELNTNNPEEAVLKNDLKNELIGILSNENIFSK